MVRRDKGPRRKGHKLSHEVPETALNLGLICNQRFLAAAGEGDIEQWTVSTVAPGADPALVDKPADGGGTHTLQLAAWQHLPALVAWFARGTAANPEAELKFPAALSKELRAEVHMCAGSTRGVESISKGLGEERRVIVISAAAAAAAASTQEQQSSRAAKEDAYVLYKLAQQQGLARYSRDEIGELLQQQQRQQQQQQQETHEGCVPDELRQLMEGPLFQEQKALQQLCLAASCGNCEQVKLLLESHTGLLRQGLTDLSSRGQSLPLHLAAAGGHEEVVRLLLAAGADAHAENEAGMTALQVAQHNEECMIEALLLQAGAVDQQQDAWQEAVRSPAGS